MTKTKPVILGLGNPLFQDEGLGIHVVHRLMEEMPPGRAELIDGGTDGLLLLQVVEEAQQIIVVDAVESSNEPGTVISLPGEEITLAGQKNLSPHQLSFQEVLALARLRGKFPAEMVLIGVRPESMDWGTELTPVVAKSVPGVLNKINEQLEIWYAQKKEA